MVAMSDEAFVAAVRQAVETRSRLTGGSYLDHLAERVYWYPAWALNLPLAWLGAAAHARHVARRWRRGPARARSGAAPLAPAPPTSGMPELM